MPYKRNHEQKNLDLSVQQVTFFEGDVFFGGLPFLKGFPVISEKLKVTVSPEFPGVKLVNDVTTPLPIIVADAHRITQLIYNLVTNAIKFFGGELLRVVRF